MVLSSVFLTPLCSSVNSGSTRVWSLMSFCRALAAHMRTARVGSFSALMKVVCSWGRNGFNMAPTWNMKHVYHTGHKRCTLLQVIKKEDGKIQPKNLFIHAKIPLLVTSLHCCLISLRTHCRPTPCCYAILNLPSWAVVRIVTTPWSRKHKSD